jgi:hypothetical protein
MSIERGDIQPSLIFFLLLASFSGFNFLLSALISSKKNRKSKDFFPGPNLASNQAFSCYLK